MLRYHIFTKSFIALKNFQFPVQVVACQRLCNVSWLRNIFVIRTPPAVSQNCLTGKWKDLPGSRSLYFNARCLSSANALRESENTYAHKVLEEIPKYSETLMDPKLGIEPIDDKEFRRLTSVEWNDESAESVCKAFESISYYCSHKSYSLSDAIFTNICHSLTLNCKDMTDCELIRTLACLSKWPQTDFFNSVNFSTLWSTLDKECVQRYKQWDRNKLLLVADHWYMLHLSRFCEYMWFSNWKLGRKPSSLSPAQLVQTMFYMNACRKIHPNISMYEFEYSFEQCIDKLTLEEISIMSMGFFKTQTKIKSSNLLYKILERTMSEVDSIKDITLSAILKIVRYSITPSLADMLYQLLNKLVLRVNDLSLLSCIHTALAGSNVLIFHEDILKSVSQRFSRAIKDARVKDLERLAFVLTLYNYDPHTDPCIFSQIANELSSPNRKEEFASFPKCVPRCLHYLTIKDIFLDDLISQVLDPEFIAVVYGKNSFHINREILSLDAFVEIERPHYTGNRLPPKTRGFLAKRYNAPLPKEKKNMTATMRMFMEVMELVSNMLGGEKYCYVGHILPHFERSDIAFFVSRGRAVEIPMSLRESELSAVKYAPSLPETGSWCCIVVGGWNSYISNTRKMLGTTECKIHQLKTIGYSPIYVPWYEWVSLASTARERYLRDKIEAACAR
ncbi:FAST kinase domain-containing protein 5, mitochondrial [Anabrus simplex]|uniref:FAST kinase domain-containing protein 5, mitochondrial n=1 Tax=Anabrus simplex TaxID=316456 RepID=UPI0035A35DD1